MWFKNVRIYRFTKPFAHTVEALEEKLTEQAFQPCGKHDQEKYGWVSPLGRHGKMLTHTVGGYTMICAQKQEKILPSCVVNDAIHERIEEIEHKQDRKVFRKERQQLKEDVTLELLPKAFTRDNTTYAYISPKENLLVIDASSATKAEELLSYLRGTIESLPVILPSTKNVPSSTMTEWLLHQTASHDFEIDQECELYNPSEDGNVVRCKGQDLASDEIQGHLSAGKQVKKLGLLWKGALSCIIEDDLTIKRLKFQDMILEKAAEADAESAAEQFDQDFAVMTLELSRFFNALFGAFGGLQERPDVAGLQQQDVEKTTSSDDTDPLYSHAVTLVIETRRASISNIQRSLKIGYNRAARMIELMEVRGVVSEMQKDGSRDVLTATQSNEPNQAA